jgi:hypothetical protein
MNDTLSRDLIPASQFFPNHTQEPRRVIQSHRVIGKACMVTALRGACMGGCDGDNSPFRAAAGSVMFGAPNS